LMSQEACAAGAQGVAGIGGFWLDTANR